MDIISILFILFLIFMIAIGIKNGFFYTFIQFFRHIATLIIGILLAKPLGYALFHTSLGNKLNQSLYNVFYSISEKWSATLTTSKEEAVQQIVNDIPASFQENVKNMIAKQFPNYDFENLAEVFSRVCSIIICMLIVFIIVSIICSIFFLLFKKLAKKVNKIPLIGFINRLGGAIMGGVVGIFFLTIFCFIISLCIQLPGSFSVKLTELFSLNSDSFSFAKWLYELHLFEHILQLFI